MASVSWDYPKDRMLALQRQAQAASAAAPVNTGLSLEKIRFRYAISGSNPPWKPLRAFDDGENCRRSSSACRARRRRGSACAELRGPMVATWCGSHGSARRTTAP